MPIELNLIKQNGTLTPATVADQEKLATLSHGQHVIGSLKSSKSRSLKWHRMYFGGLLKLALDYWEPKGGYISKQEKDFAVGLVEFLESNNLDASPYKFIMTEYMKDLRATRKQEIPTPNKSVKHLHEWVKEECGHYDYILTPDGIKKEPKSINFNTMSHEEWQEYYKKAFNVVWKLVLSNVYKGDMQACEKAINELLNMG